MKVQFIGATHEVTGSCTLLEVSGRYYLVDCGMEQGEDIFQNVPLPVPANAIEAVFLTHAHIDHSGMLPKLCKDGFRGQIYATEATCNLCRIMLMDSAHIQESEAQWRTRKAERAGERAVEPVYDTNDAAATLRLLRPCQYNAAVQAAEGIIIRMTDIGHLLGSAAIEMWLTEGKQTRKIVFSGDVGNVNQPLLRDRQPVAETEYLVIESTYGDRLHPKERGDVVGELAACIIADSVIRIIPGAIGDEASALTDCFQDNLLAPPVYTRPAEFNGWKVPDVLLSGNFARIDRWKEEQAWERTKRLRPDLLKEE